MLRAFCRRYHIIPEAYLIPSSSISSVTEFMVAQGGYSDVYKGRYTYPDGGSVDVALKVLRVPVSLDDSENSDVLGKVCINQSMTIGLTAP